MRLLMVAPPGSGKGTQAKRLAEHYGIAHLSSGDLLRKEVAAGTDIGKAAQAYLERGDLVPDDLVLKMLTIEVLEASADTGYVLDGFPRTLRQAEAAYQIAKQFEDVTLQAVIHLEVGPEELRRRLLGRAHREGRVDDDEVTVNHRLEVYARDTQPLLSFYADRGLVIDINGEQTIEKVFADIVAAVDGLLAGRH
jgi:adenylate kinase